jgi:hypothetical protein
VVWGLGFVARGRRWYSELEIRESELGIRELEDRGQRSEDRGQKSEVGIKFLTIRGSFLSVGF